MKAIEITISGRSGVGKSAIAQLIRDALHNAGIFYELEHQITIRSTDAHSDVLKNLAPSTTVLVVENTTSK